MDFYLTPLHFLTDLAVNAKSCLNSNLYFFDSWRLPCTVQYISLPHIHAEHDNKIIISNRQPVDFIRIVRASSAPKGSSSRRTVGSPASPLAMAALCDIPPDSWLG